MKKFLIGVVFLIPIIIVLAISATGRIIALSNPLNANRMEIRNNQNEVVEQNVNDIFYIDASNDSVFIVVDLYPSITEQSIIYTINTDIPNAGELQLVREQGTNHYRFVPVYDEYGVAKSGVVQLTIYAANNISVSRTVTVVIKSEIITDIKIYGDDGQIISGSLPLLAPAQLFCDVNPMDALDYDSLVWHSSNPNVAAVSANGFVTPVSRGTAAVSVSAQDKKGNTHTESISVNTTNALVKAVNVTTSEQHSVNWVKANLLLSQSAAVSDMGQGGYLVSENGTEKRVQVSACGYDDAVFPTALQTMYTQNGPYYLHLQYADIRRKDAMPAVSYEISDPSVLQLDSAKNMLIPLKAGSANITARYAGKTAQTTVTIKERPYAFNLLYSDSDAKLGIQRTRVWGLNWLSESKQNINTLQFGCSLDRQKSDVKWSTDNPDYATVDDNALITFYPQAAGQDVRVRATVLVNNFETNIYREFVFNMADNASAVNVYNYDEFRYVVNNTTADIVMQNNVVAQDTTLYVKGSVFGNGFMYDARSMAYVNSSGFLRVENNYVSDTEKVIEFNDVWVEAAQNIDESIKRGVAIYIRDIVNPVKIRFCILQYCDTGVRLQRAKDVLVEGCIMGYSASYAIECISGLSPTALTLKNSVFRQTGGPSVLLAPDDFDSAYFDRSYIPTVKIQGFLDVTNWKTPDDLHGLLAGLDASAFSGVAGFIDPQTLFDSITGILESIVTDAGYLLYTNPSDNKQYVCTAIFTMGMYTKPNKNLFIIDDPNFVLLPVSLPKEGSIGLLMSTVNAIMQSKLNMTIFHPNYLLSYDFSGGKKPKYGPGDSIPQNFELYNRLVKGDPKSESKSQIKSR